MSDVEIDERNEENDLESEDEIDVSEPTLPHLYHLRVSRHRDQLRIHNYCLMDLVNRQPHLKFFKKKQNLILVSDNLKTSGTIVGSGWSTVLLPIGIS